MNEAFEDDVVRQRHLSVAGPRGSACSQNSIYVGAYDQVDSRKDSVSGGRMSTYNLGKPGRNRFVKIETGCIIDF